MASIKKRPNGSYQATIYTGRDQNGKQMFKYVTKTTLKECKATARKIEQEVEDGTYINIENVRVMAWIEEQFKLKKLSPSTRATYKSYVKNHYTPFFGSMKLGQINETHIKRFTYEKSKNLSQSSVRRMTSPLKSIFNELLRERSPMKNIKLPKEEKYMPRVLTEKEMHELHAAVKGTRDEPIILLAAWCGLRRGEIFALKWNDINWDKGLILIDESYAINTDNMYEDKRPKSENGMREVVVPKYLLNLLYTLRKSQTEISERIFSMRPDSFSSYFPKLLRRNGLPRTRFHDLRHYHASWLYAMEVPDQYAAERLGHDIQVLKTIYQHLGLDKKAEIDNNIRYMYTGIDKSKTRLTGD